MISLSTALWEEEAQGGAEERDQENPVWEGRYRWEMQVGEAGRRDGRLIASPVVLQSLLRSLHLDNASVEEALPSPLSFPNIPEY